MSKQISYWENKHAVIAGGSSGLGLHFVRTLARAKAKITIIGRDQSKLDRACSIAIDAGAIGAESVSCDISDAGCEAKLLEVFNSSSIDLLVNAIGKSDRGELARLEMREIEEQLRTNVLGTFELCRMLRAGLLRGVSPRGKGIVINIGSLAGIVSAPNMGGYCISKHALTALTRQLRLEWKPSGIHVMLLAPGPIARDDSGSRYTEIAAARGIDIDQANRPGGGANIRLIDPVKLTSMALDQALKGKSEIIYPRKVGYLAAIGALFPSLADWLLAKNLKT